MSEPKSDDENRDVARQALAPYGAGVTADSKRNDHETDLDDHGALGLCGEDHIGGCFL